MPGGLRSAMRVFIWTVAAISIQLVLGASIFAAVS